jgi:hypothetical protein
MSRKSIRNTFVWLQTAVTIISPTDGIVVDFVAGGNMGVSKSFMLFLVLGVMQLAHVSSPATMHCRKCFPSLPNQKN